jgi:hypothetical protein
LADLLADLFGIPIEYELAEVTRRQHSEKNDEKRDPATTWPDIWPIADRPESDMNKR